MILITDLEAEQRRVVKTPLGCNGNCNQGRACDCAPDYEEVPSPSLQDARLRAFFWRGVALMYAAIGLAFLVRWLLS
jgi:hypothetical protein